MPAIQNGATRPRRTAALRIIGKLGVVLVCLVDALLWALLAYVYFFAHSETDQPHYLGGTILTVLFALSVGPALWLVARGHATGKAYIFALSFLALMLLLFAPLH